VKNATQRINDTLNFIRGNDIASYALKASAYSLANRFITAHYPPGNAGQQAYRTFSEGMSMSGVRNSGSEPQRQIRRALYLIWHAIQDVSPVMLPADLQNQITRVLALPPASLRDDFLWTLHKARAVDDGTGGNNRDHACSNLLAVVIPADPLAFLRANKIMIFGSNAYAPDPQDRNVVNFYMRSDAGHDRYEFGPHGGMAPPAGSHIFAAASVTAVHWTTVPGRGNVENPGPGAGATWAGITGIRLDGADTMTTTQFTGCSFCVKSGGGQVYAAHISPSVPGVANPFSNGTNMARQICGSDPNVGAGDFANHGAGVFQVYGMGHSDIPGLGTGYPVRGVNPTDLNTMCLIGFRRGGNWGVYSQHTSRAGSIMGAYQIV
jgi:hypothetical protein